jgi:hypothetical protein
VLGNGGVDALIQTLKAKNEIKNETKGNKA